MSDLITKAKKLIQRENELMEVKEFTSHDYLKSIEKYQAHIKRLCDQILVLERRCDRTANVRHIADWINEELRLSRLDLVEQKKRYEPHRTGNTMGRIEILEEILNMF